LTLQNNIPNDYLILIPCYECYKTLTFIIDSCLKITKNILIVDDGSKSFDKKYFENKDVNFLRIPENHGIGFALSVGIEKALNNGFKSIITLDSDGQHEPKYIIPMVNYHIRSRNQLTIGNRWKNIEVDDNFSSSKYFSNRFASQLIEIISKIYIQDVACGFRIINLEHYGLSVYSKGYGFLYEMILFFLKKSLTIGNFPISRVYEQDKPLITRLEEFLHLTNSLINVCTNVVIKKELEYLKQLLIENSEISVRIVSNQSEINYYLFPIRKYKGYLFQGRIIRNQELNKGFQIEQSISVSKDIK